jgi:hypothetical protein
MEYEYKHIVTVELEQNVAHYVQMIVCHDSRALAEGFGRIDTLEERAEILLEKSVVVAVRSTPLSERVDVVFFAGFDLADFRAFLPGNGASPVKSVEETNQCIIGFGGQADALEAHEEPLLVDLPILESGFAVDGFVVWLVN